MTTVRYIPMLVLFCACQEETEPVEFPDVIEPIEEIRVEAPAGTSSQPYPEEYTVLSGDEGDYAWVHLRGYIHTDMAQAWTAIRNPDVYINQRNVAEYSVEESSSELYDYIFLVHNRVEDIVDVEFDNEWRHAAVDGTKDAPERVAVRWQKINGTEFIPLLDGSIQILPVADGRKDIVEVQVIEHLGATLDQEANALQYVTDLYERWQLVAHGEEIPVYED